MRHTAHIRAWGVRIRKKGKDPHLACSGSAAPFLSHHFKEATTFAKELRPHLPKGFLIRPVRVVASFTFDEPSPRKSK